MFCMEYIMINIVLKHFKGNKFYLIPSEKILILMDIIGVKFKNEYTVFACKSHVKESRH